MKSIEFRERLYDSLSDSEEPLESRIDKALEVGVEYLDLPIGFFTRIDSNTQEIVRSTGNHDLIQPGETCPLDEAYCRRTVEIASPLAIQDTDASSAISEAAVERFRLGTYIGARIIVKGETYGTICFADTESRGQPFSDAESYFVELAARLVGQALEQQIYQRELAEREAEIGTKEEVYRAVVDSSFDLVFQIGSEGQFTYVSSTVADLLGYSSEWYLGQPFTVMLPDQETIDLAEDTYLAVMAGETVEREYFPLQHRTKGQVLVDIRVTPLFDANIPPEDRTPADIVGVQGMARDARGRRRRQRILGVLNRVLRHNLRNDMNVISGYAEMLQDRLRNEELTYARKISEIADQLVALSDTARQLETNLDAAPEIDTVDIVPVIVQVANQIEEQYPEARVTVNTPESAKSRTAPRLETAVWELMENAAKHAGEEPSITVTVRVEESSTRIRIEDDGPGLPENERTVLLSGDETPLEHGSGLGLWLAYWIIESLDGYLTVEETEEGTCIDIVLR